MLLDKVCAIIFNVKQVFDTNKADFDRHSQVPYRQLNTKTRVIRDVLIHDALRGFAPPGPIEARTEREFRHIMKQRTTILWDICQEINETKDKARSLARDQTRRRTWIDSLDDIYKNYLRGKLSGGDFEFDSNDESEPDIASDDEIDELNVAIHVGDAENIFLN